MQKKLSVIAILAAFSLLQACSTPAPKTEPAPAAAAPTPPKAEAAPPAPLDPLKDPNSPLAKRSVYFDYDSYQLKDSDKSLLLAHANYLGGHQSQKLVIQGNTDERGGAEYNLALGQKRAEATRKALTLGGAKDSQIETVSFGKEKPKAEGHDEAAWSQNRRADLVYQ